MAKSDKELKPLLDKSNHQHHQQAQQQCHTSNHKKLSVKGKTSSKPKLLSVSETSVETAEGSRKEERGDQCSEKDVDETETHNMKQSKKSSQGSLHPRPPDQLQTSTGEMFDQHSHNFGVKSYLHHFYESVSQTPSVDENNYQYLVQPKGSRCGAIWFKIGLIIGATLFLLGAVAIVIGYAIPKQRVIMGISENIEVIDNDARRFNENLDRCKLIGLAGFCSGGLILVISLLAPTFTSTYWEDDPVFMGFVPSSLVDHIAQDSNNSPIPVTEKIKCIQPVWAE